jgi:hypothetical protein
MYGRQPALQGESDNSAKRSGAVMHPAFKCGRFDRWPRCDPLIGPKQKHALFPRMAHPGFSDRRSRPFRINATRHGVNAILQGRKPSLLPDDPAPKEQQNQQRHAALQKKIGGA